MRLCAEDLFFYRRRVNSTAGIQISPGALDALRAIVGRDAVIANPHELAVYECDAYTLEKHLPAVVVLPKSAEEVAAVVKLHERT